MLRPMTFFFMKRIWFLQRQPSIKKADCNFATSVQTFSSASHPFAHGRQAALVHPYSKAGVHARVHMVRLHTQRQAA